MSRHPFLIGTALLVLSACGDGGSGPADPGDGQRIATEFEKLADQIGDSGSSPTVDALRHAADVVRLVGHATPVTVTIENDVFVPSPAVTKWNTNERQWNFAELIDSGPTGFNVTIDVYNNESAKMNSDTIFLGGEFEFDFDVNDSIRRSASRRSWTFRRMSVKQLAPPAS